MNSEERPIVPAIVGDSSAHHHTEKRVEMPLPHNVHTLLLLGIFLLLMFYTLYFVREIALPIIIAVVLYLLLQPGMRLLLKLHVPKILAALLMISVLGGGVSGLGFVLSGPVSDWVASAPETLPRLERRLAFLTKPLQKVQQTSDQLEKVTDTTGDAVRTVAVKGPGLRGFLLNGTHVFLTSVVTSVVLLFFLLVSGDLFLRRLVEILPTLSDKKQVVDIANEIERHISGYLMTISLMNAAVGIAGGIDAYFCGLPNPILWGTVAFLLNYVLILGPLACVAAFLVAGLFTFDNTWHAVLPAVIYFMIHVLEGESITPMLLARRLTLNPVLIIISLVFWYWMWGIVGALIAVPLLGTFKIICDRIRPLMAIGHFLGTEPRA